MASIQFMSPKESTKALRLLRGFLAISDDDGRSQGDIIVEPCEPPRWYHSVTGVTRDSSDAPEEGPSEEAHDQRRVPCKKQSDSRRVTSMNSQSDDENDTPSGYSESSSDDDTTVSNTEAIWGEGVVASTSVVQLPAVKYGRPRRLLRPTDVEPLITVSMRGDMQFISQRTRSFSSV